MDRSQGEIKGRAGKDPEVRFTAGGTAVMNIPVAVNKMFNKDTANPTQVTEWWTIVLFGKFAEDLNGKVHKGSRVWAKGELQQRNWKDKTGNDRQSTELRAFEFELLQDIQCGAV